MIVVECNYDVVLVRSLVGASQKVNHPHIGGKPAVCNLLKQRRDCLGLVDEDPQGSQPPYVKELRLLDDIEQHGIKVFLDRRRNNHVVVLCPELEPWVFEAVREAGLDILNRHNLSRNISEFSRQLKLHPDRLERLLATNDLKKSARLKALSGLLRSHRSK